MRDIRFKAKRLDNNEWITGDLLQVSEKDVQIYNKLSLRIESVLTAIIMLSQQKTSGYSRCYINIIKPEDTDNKFWYCSKITICGEIYMSKDVYEQAEWLLGLFERASRITPISELEFRNKWNEATNIIKQIEKL